MADDVINPVEVDIRTPEKWSSKHFHVCRGQRVFAFVISWCPTSLMFGPELIVGYSRGIGLALGPIWLGFATVKVARHG